MKKFLSFFFISAILAFMSCSNLDKDPLSPVQDSKHTVQGIPYDVSLSSIKGLNTITTRANDPSGDPNFSMDDIKYWVGTGSNRAALVIEWHDGKTPDALVWGYRWDGDAYGFDMIREIVKADPRLIFLTHMTGSMGYTIAGLGYNINKSGNHYLIYNNKVNDPKYPSNGIVYTTSYNYDNWKYSDVNDHWSSGWYKGYWSYWVKNSQKDTWVYSNLGASSRKLVNGSWDGWSFLYDMSQWEGNKLGNKFTPARLN